MPHNRHESGEFLRPELLLEEDSNESQSSPRRYFQPMFATWKTLLDDKVQSIERVQDLKSILILEIEKRFSEERNPDNQNQAHGDDLDLFLM